MFDCLTLRCWAKEYCELVKWRTGELEEKQNNRNRNNIQTTKYQTLKRHSLKQ